MLARFSCTLLSGVPFLSMSFVFSYGIIYIFMSNIIIRKISQREFILLLLVVVYDMFVVVKTTTNGEGLFNTQAFNSYILLMMYSLYLSIKHSENEREKQTYYWVCMSGYIVTIVYSIIHLVSNPLASRIAATGSKASGGVVGIGGFDTVYGTVFLVFTFLYNIEKSRNKRKRFINISFLVISLIFIVMASYATAFVLVAIGLVMYFFNKNRILSISIFISLVIIFCFRENIGLVIMNSSKGISYSNTLSTKIYQIGYIIKYGESTGTLAGSSGRINMMLNSIQVFFENPITGAYGSYDVSIGGHSELFDTLARFGLCGFIPIVCFWIGFFLDVKEVCLIKDSQKYIHIIATLYLLLSILNPSLYTQQLLPLFIILPISLEDYSKKELLTNC